MTNKVKITPLLTLVGLAVMGILVFHADKNTNAEFRASVGITPKGETVGRDDDGQQGQNDDGQQGYKDDGQQDQKEDGQQGQYDDGQQG